MSLDVRPNYYRVKVTREDGEEIEVECFGLIRALGLDFFEGNALKYLWRAGRKTTDRREDYRKAITYLRQALDTEDRRLS